MAKGQGEDKKGWLVFLLFFPVFPFILLLNIAFCCDFRIYI